MGTRIDPEVTPSVTITNSGFLGRTDVLGFSRMNQSFSEHAQIGGKCVLVPTTYLYSWWY